MDLSKLDPAVYRSAARLLAQPADGSHFFYTTTGIARAGYLHNVLRSKLAAYSVAYTYVFDPDETWIFSKKVEQPFNQSDRANALLLMAHLVEDSPRI